MAHALAQRNLDATVMSRRLLGWLLFLTFDLMLLGAGVRAMDAGLACPDWPLCFGQLIPDGHLGVYLEYIHRIVAGLVFLLFVTLMFSLSRIPHRSRTTRFLTRFGLIVLFAQILMGGLTVLKLLESAIVLKHLALATVFFATLFLLRHSVERDSQPVEQSSSGTRSKAFVALPILVFGQILLGGWVASTYAGLVCIDFPTCMGKWIPTLSGPIGIQVLHRFGAYFVALVILFLAAYVHLRRAHYERRTIRVTAILSGIVLLQIAVGVLNLKLLIPAWLTVIHLGLAVLLLRFSLELALTRLSR